MTLLYDDHAELYDRIYHWKDYAAEAARLVQLLDAEGVRGGRVLEAGIGTGAHAVHLRERFRVDGFDLGDGMLAVARQKLPDAALWQAHMRSFHVEEPYDALLCLFSAIGYLLDEDALRDAASAMAAAVRPGGALIVEPWLPLEAVDAGRPALQTYDAPDLKIARATVLRIEGEIVVMPMHYLVARRGQPVEAFAEEHRMWCAPRETLLRAFRDAGFDVRFDPDGLMKDRGLLIGRRETPCPLA